jgi:hypothetical protein
LKCTVWVFFFASLAVMGAHASAQNGRTITIRMLDSKTGKVIPPTKFQVTVNTTKVSSVEAVFPDKDGIGQLVVQNDAVQLSIQALYEPHDRIFVNCDQVKDTIFFQNHWYGIAEIFSTGTVVPNKCSKMKSSAKPGEFVFFVRPMNWYERMTE